MSVSEVSSSARIFWVSDYSGCRLYVAVRQSKSFSLFQITAKRLSSLIELSQVDFQVPGAHALVVLTLQSIFKSHLFSKPPNLKSSHIHIFTINSFWTSTPFSYSTYIIHRTLQYPTLTTIPTSNIYLLIDAVTTDR